MPQIATMQFSFEDILEESKHAPDGKIPSACSTTETTSCDSSFELEKFSFSKEIDLKTTSKDNSVSISGKTRLDVFLAIEEESSDLKLRKLDQSELLTCRSMLTETSIFSKKI